MALDNAQFISELSITDPPGTDAVAEGDDHIRTTKRATQQSFPNVDAAVPQTAAQMGQMAIKNEANTFTLNNTFDGVNTFFQNAVVQSVTGTERALQLHNNGIRQWAWRQEGVANDIFLDRYVAGNFQDSPISASNSSGEVIFANTIDVGNQIRCKANLLMQQKAGNNEDVDIRFQQFTPGATRWRLRSTATSFNFQIRRQDANGIFVDSPVTISGTTGEVTFPNLCTFDVGLTALDGAISMDRVDTTRNLNWRRNGFSVWQIQHQNDANDNAWRLRRNNLTSGALLSVPIRVQQSDGLIFLTLQSSDPGVSGALWNSSGFVAVSP